MCHVAMQTDTARANMVARMNARKGQKLTHDEDRLVDRLIEQLADRRIAEAALVRERPCTCKRALHWRGQRFGCLGERLCETHTHGTG